MISDLGFKTLLLLCVAVPLCLTAAENEQRVPSTITNVTVFINQAQVTRVAKVNLQAGITNLVFDKVSPFINLNSIQVKTEDNVLLMSVSQRNNYLEKEEKPAFIKEIEDTINTLSIQIQLCQIKRDALLLEKDVMLANKKMGSEQAGTKIDDLEDAMNLFRKRSQEIGEEMMKIEASEKRLSAVMLRFQQQLDEYNNNENSTAELVVTVKTLGPVNNAKIEWSYLVTNASWVPFYDVRVKDTKSNLQLVSKAYITQNTGEVWKNVVLKLSTANPNESGSKPELSTNFLNFTQPENYGYMNRSAAPMQAQDMMAPSGMAESKKVAYSKGVAQVQQSAINVEFNVTAAYTIPSDGIQHQVDLTVTDLKANYGYGCVPKLDKNAFVTAKVSGNDLVNQVGGEANVYFDGTFVGKTYINGTTSDSMLISLGRDKRLQIQRNLLKDFSSRTLAGSNKKEVTTWEISLRNTRKEPVTIIVEDQIPVSSDKDIEIKLTQAGNAQYNAETGKLVWIVQLAPEQSQALRFTFEVKYPKDKTISNY